MVSVNIELDDKIIFDIIRKELIREYMYAGFSSVTNEDLEAIKRVIKYYSTQSQWSQFLRGDI